MQLSIQIIFFFDPTPFESYCIARQGMPSRPPDHDIESQPLLTPPAPPPSRLGALTTRSISQASIALTPSNRWWTLTTAALVIILVTSVVLGIITADEHHVQKPGPDWTVLPPPAPGLRNPSYLISGHHGAVASEVDLCSQVGVEGTLSS
jgi:gamma-glutamyltranspeptidase/glutathione hydrolase/leukotriene-C4 hydrolase